MTNLHGRHAVDRTWLARAINGRPDWLALISGALTWTLTAAMVFVSGAFGAYVAVILTT